MCCWQPEENILTGITPIRALFLESIFIDQATLNGTRPNSPSGVKPARRSRSGASCAASSDLAPGPGSLPLIPASQSCEWPASKLYPRVRAAGMHTIVETVAWMAHVSAGGEGRGLPVSLKLSLLQRFPAVRTSSMIILRHSRVVYGLFPTTSSCQWSGQDRLPVHVGAPLGRHSLTNGPGATPP